MMTNELAADVLLDEIFDTRPAAAAAAARQEALDAYYDWITDDTGERLKALLRSLTALDGSWTDRISEWALDSVREETRYESLVRVKSVSVPLPQEQGQ